jgi:hypothetical protein
MFIEFQTILICSFAIIRRQGRSEIALKVVSFLEFEMVFIGVVDFYL